jgi:hypothetical protein
LPPDPSCFSFAVMSSRDSQRVVSAAPQIRQGKSPALTGGRRRNKTLEARRAGLLPREQSGRIRAGCGHFMLEGHERGPVVVVRRAERGAGQCPRRWTSGVRVSSVAGQLRESFPRFAGFRSICDVTNCRFSTSTCWMSSIVAVQFSSSGWNQPIARGICRSRDSAPQTHSGGTADDSSPCPADSTRPPKIFTYGTEEHTQ